MARPIAAVVFTLGCLQAGAVSALGLGELTLDSFLNEPFKARVDLLNTEGLSEHQIRIRLATSDDFNRMGVDRAYFLTSITFEIEIDDQGHGQILLSSEAPVLEPFLDFIVEARWPTGRLLREYTVLVDPPVFDSNQTVTVSASEIADEVEVNSAVKKKSQAATSGTNVKLGKSNLAPGAMPRRNFGSDASEAPLSGNRYMIHRDDTLWAIAKRAKPEGTSIHQTMLDIQRMNPRAFIGGNINRIKAGYIIYLPASGDISSDDTASAIEEVQQQNQDWREEVIASGGSLRISSSTVGDGDSTGSGSAGGAGAGSSADLANLENLDRSERDLADVEQRLEAMSEQVDTLERIVTLKDDQIAALQNALAEATAAEGEGEPSETMADADAEVETATADMGADSLDVAGQTDAAADAEPEAEPQAEVEPEPAAEVKPAAEVTPPAVTSPRAAEEEGGFFGNIMYIGGLLLAVIVGIWVFLRRRAGKTEDEPVAEDVFADIHLEEEDLEVVADSDVEAAPSEFVKKEEAPEEPTRSRGYGERKNDEYAADMDTVDALAEADIYTAYGRFPQAVDLLKTAIGNEPRNPAYKLKLMEVCSEMGDHAETMKQYADVKALDDPDSLANADEILRAIDGSAEPAPGPRSDNPLDLPDDLDLDLPDLELAAGDGDINLEEEFGELEIEGFDSELSEDDLDLSKDFAETSVDSVLEDGGEEMVFATEGDPVSTKLDLARAYLDMGDQDGARAIFEEIVAEGNAEQKQEALALLERLG